MIVLTALVLGTAAWLGYHIARQWLADKAAALR